MLKPSSPQLRLLWTPPDSALPQVHPSSLFPAGPHRVPLRLGTPSPAPRPSLLFQNSSLLPFPSPHPAIAARILLPSPRPLAALPEAGGHITPSGPQFVRPVILLETLLVATNPQRKHTPYLGHPQHFRKPPPHAGSSCTLRPRAGVPGPRRRPLAHLCTGCLLRPLCLAPAALRPGTSPRETTSCSQPWAWALCQTLLPDFGPGLSSRTWEQAPSSYNVTPDAGTPSRRGPPSKLPQPTRPGTRPHPWAVALPKPALLKSLMHI